MYSAEVSQWGQIRQQSWFVSLEWSHVSCLGGADKHLIYAWGLFLLSLSTVPSCVTWSTHAAASPDYGNTAWSDAQSNDFSMTSTKKTKATKLVVWFNDISSPVGLFVRGIEAQLQTWLIQQRVQLLIPLFHRLSSLVDLWHKATSGSRVFCWHFSDYHPKACMHTPHAVHENNHHPLPRGFFQVVAHVIMNVQGQG